MTDDIIELTIYSDITHIDITNHTDIRDMSIAALSLLPRLEGVWAGGSPLTNLGIIMICSAHTITTLDLSKSVTNVASCAQHAVAVYCLACMPSLMKIDAPLQADNLIVFDNCWCVTSPHFPATILDFASGFGL